MSDPAPPRTSDPTTGELVSQLSEQTTRLVRDEVALAKVELTEKAKHVGIGAGLFSGAGLVALYGVGALVATAILGLAEAVPAWLAALIVTVVLFAIAGVVALLGKRHVDAGTPVTPERTIDNVKQDLDTVKEARSHDHA
jgi:tetrahydromethanopterin S-methyltransferase subunit C